MLRRQERGEKRIMCNVDNEKKGKDIARYTKDDTRDSGTFRVEFLSVCIGSRHLGARSRRKATISTIVSSPWTWNTCIETFHRFFFFFSFFNLLSFPFLRKGRFSPRFSEWNVNFDARKLKKKKVLSNYLSIAIFKIKAFVSFNYILPSSFHIFCIELDFFGIFFARVEKEKKKK